MYNFAFPTFSQLTLHDLEESVKLQLNVLGWQLSVSGFYIRRKIKLKNVCLKI